MAGKKINVLDEQLANQIAAGEVVERPASIIKELIENAIDAGSTTVDIAVEEGGLTLIRVADNGDGIPSEDMPQAFQRHATSKIASNSDLFRIASLGFRGEALPSIAAVSRLEMISSESDTGLARRLVLEGGTVTADEPCNALQGTAITVRDIFYNTPARLKYMKSIQTELGHISDYINRIALAHPGIAFTLQHNGNSLLRTLGTGDRLQVIAAVYGSNTAKAMHQLAASDADYTVNGYVSKPELSRSNRNGITAIVNGRYIRSFMINQALANAYHTYLPIHRYPLAVIEIEMHPSLLDVNVHPSKMEVRFSKEQELRQLIEHAVKAVLESERYIPKGADSLTPPRTKPAYVQDSISFHMNDFNRESKNKLDQPEAGASRFVPSKQEVVSRPLTNSQTGIGNRNPGEAYQERSASYVAIPKDATERLYAPASSKQADFTSQESADAPEKPPLRTGQQVPLEGAGAFPELHWIGQHHGTYIVAQAEDGLYLVDQHAAHERIHYEHFLQKFANAEMASQNLLVPITLEFTAAEAAQLKSQLDLLLEAGVELEPFGPQTFLVRSLPEWLPKGQEHELLEEMTNWLLAERKAVPIGKLREKAAIMCACKASIKANDRISREEGETLLQRLSACEQPYTCPHGRPIIVHFSIYQLQKMFKRVMS